LQIDAAWTGQELADEDLKRMAEASERIASQRMKSQDDQAAVVAWLKTKRDEIGLTAFAKVLGVDGANLGKAIEGKRKLPRVVLLKIESTLILPEK
jgi:hypothetical protein